MKITQVTGEIGTTDTRQSIEIGSSAALDIAMAITWEHDCDSSSCDICLANWAGYPFSAAYLLQGATETPLLDLVLQAHIFNGTMPAMINGSPRDWEDWTTFFKENTVECEGCGAFNYDSDSCGNCLADLPRKDNENE